MYSVKQETRDNLFTIISGLTKRAAVAQCAALNEAARQAPMTEGWREYRVVQVLNSTPVRK